MKTKKETERKHLLRFIEKTAAFDNRTKRNLLLFVAGAKPNTYARLRIENNLHDKHEFERLLRLSEISFISGKLRGFEEIVSVKGNKVVWKFVGTWHGYDLFRNAADEKLFKEYVGLVKKQKHEEADRLAGKLYGYPRCCVEEFIKEHDPAFMTKKYTYASFYKELEDADRSLPFISFTPGSVHCPEAVKLNAHYGAVLKKAAPTFYSAYSKKRTHRAQLIVDTENEFMNLKHERNAHDYVLASAKPIEKKYLLMSWLADKKYRRGTVLDADVTIQYDSPAINVRKVIRTIKNFHHERKFAQP